MVICFYLHKLRTNSFNELYSREGTSNVMALDVLRAIAKTGGESLKAFAARVTQITDRLQLNVSAIN
jgi:hypothetical protein